MDKKDLQKKLNKPYSTENWREVVQFVFPNVQILNPPMVIPIDNDKVESFRQLGNVQLHDGKSLALFELNLKANVNIIRNRVELNNIVSQYIDQDQTHGVLSIFEQGGDDYRFTFSARASEFDEKEGDFITKKTDTKRFTYVLGKNESCKTPAQRFYELSENKNKAEIKDIENAFSVEKLSKAFFKEYKDQYNAFVNYMMQTPGIFTAIYSQDDKAIRDFVKILLGRIIFIKFVQKKGWMGVEGTSKKWLDGDYRFLENGFANFKHQDLFYSTFLEPLFETLDQPNRPNDVFSVTNTRVPYLSGGLFELEDKKTKNINFPAKYFNDLFEFLDRYNFTIDENDTNDHEVGIDQEMLGHIFENLLEDNKDKGAFYTPKEIVRYMCQESLKEYLKTSLENHKQWPTDETEAMDFEQALHNFVTKKEAGGIIEFEETIALALKAVKICDPAIGSEAFPMGLLNEIFQLVHKLHEANSDKVERVWELKGWQPNLVKQNIIQNSIYGVDIEKGAVDVARLRFWLSLIVDEPEPKALPHLDYKIVVGNSLVSKLDVTIIDIDWEVQKDNNAYETDLFGKPKPKQFNAFEVENDEKQKQLLKEISSKQKLVFDPNSNEEKLSLEIRNLKIDLLVNQLDAMVKTKGAVAKPTGTSKTIKAQTELWLETLGWKQQIEKLQKLRKDPTGILHFFDWKLDFPEIMNEQVTDKVGFDIVIANPPYINIELIDENTKKVLFSKYKYSKGRTDIYVGFMELSFSKIIKNKGSINFIIPYSFTNQNYGNEIREFLIENSLIKSIVDLTDFFVFENAVVKNIIIQVLKKKNNDFTEIIKPKAISDFHKGNFENHKIDQKLFKELKGHRFETKNISDIITLRNKLLNNSHKLEELCLVAYGARINHKTDKSKPKSHYVSEINNIGFKPFIEGKNIQRFHHKQNGYLNYIPTEHYNSMFSELFENEKLMFINVVSSKLRFTYDTKNLYNSHTVINVVKNSDLKSAKHVSALKAIRQFGIELSEKYNLKHILAIVNSNLLNWYFVNFLSEGLHFYPDDAKSFPINKRTDCQSCFIKIINEILEKKQQNQDTKDLEQQIDNLVYKLYELTYDEVLVVEPEFGERMSLEEYESLQVE